MKTRNTWQHIFKVVQDGIVRTKLIGRCYRSNATHEATLDKQQKLEKAPRAPTASRRKKFLEKLEQHNHWVTAWSVRWLNGELLFRAFVPNAIHYDSFIRNKFMKEDSSMDIEEIRFPSPGIKIQFLWLENGILFGHKLMYGFLCVRTFRKPKKRRCRTSKY